MKEVRDALILGAFLKTLREHSQFTQQTLAERIGNKTCRVTSLETGQREPTITDLVCLAHAFNLSPMDLYRALNEELTAAPPKTSPDT